MTSSLDAEARRLRELFKGRFDQETAKKLIENLGGVLEAVDFVLNEDPNQVSDFMKESPAYLDNIRTDSAKLASILTNQIQDSVRQFVCGDCKRSWWHKVPLRKEVSRCRRCKVKYDPIPKEFESGVGKFLCPCGNEFSGFAYMGETLCECYKCGAQVPVDHMTPPRRNRDRKTSAPHSCNGTNCYNISHYHGDMSLTVVTNPSVSSGSGFRGGRDKPKMLTYDKVEEPVCVHPKSAKARIRHVSKRHISTGSTVSTFLSQGSIDTQSVSVVSSLESIDE